ncbi:MAG: hypothetical protein AABW92_00930 [Nanoarchaeota archaeon]
MIDKNKVISIMKERGPVLPRDLVRELGGDTIFMGAVLSELLDNKQIKISYAKIGGSPVYYMAGQEEKLSKLYDYLNEKDKKAYDLLKSEKIINDIEADPLLRVALRNIRDFAKPLEVNMYGEKGIFWKWYLLPGTEAETIIRQKLGIKKQEAEQKKPEEQKAIEIEKKQEKKPAEKKQETQKRIEQDTDEGHKLLVAIHKIFKEKGVEILETEIIRKNTDIEMIVKIPSPVGKLTYFCKIRDKKKSNDKDLSSAYVEGQVRKLPVVYATTGELTKKAVEKLEKEFKTITILNI